MIIAALGSHNGVCQDVLFKRLPVTCTAIDAVLVGLKMLELTVCRRVPTLEAEL